MEQIVRVNNNGCDMTAFQALVVPLLPQYARDLGMGPRHMGLLGSAYGKWVKLSLECHHSPPQELRSSLELR